MNLLFIFTDEQRADTLAAYGNRQIQMPNLNRLAGQSTVFDRAYCTQPVCTASRSSLLTGLYPHFNGCTENNFPLPASIPCLPEMLAAGKYTTGYFGKWHLGDEIFAQHGFAEWAGVEDIYARHYSSGRDSQARSAYHHFLIEHGYQPNYNDMFSRDFTARLPEPVGKPAFLAEAASRFIRDHRREPFVLYVNFLEPHMPFYGPRDDQYDPAALPLPANFNAPPTRAQHLKSRLIREAYLENGYDGMPLKTEGDWRRLVANYWGLNSLVDTHAGAILRTLEDCQLMDNTVVVFTSDHGDMMGSHQMLGKCVMFEEAVRVPLLIKLPGQRHSQRIWRPVSQIDLVPTLLDLLGEQVPSELHGVSWKSELEGNHRQTAGDVFIEWSGSETGALERYRNGALSERLAEICTPEEFRCAVNDPHRTVITPEGWKLNLSTLDQHELYHLPNDPLETENLGTRKEFAPKIEELSSKIRAWQEQTKDSLLAAGWHANYN